MFPRGSTSDVCANHLERGHQTVGIFGLADGDPQKLPQDKVAVLADHNTAICQSQMYVMRVAALDMAQNEVALAGVRSQVFEFAEQAIQPTAFGTNAVDRAVQIF